MKLKQFIQQLDLMYPLANKEIWDPSGYSVKFNQAKKFKGAVLAIDVTLEVIQTAIDNDCNLILTHHPFYFEATKALEKEKAPYKQELHKLLKQHQITVYSMHTNYDCELYGTSYQIVKYLGLNQYFDTNSAKFSAIVNHSLTLNQLVDLLKNKLNLNALRTNVMNDDQQFNHIAFLSGSGYVGQINQLHDQGCDLIVSSDFRWSDWVNFDQHQVNILEVPHLDEQVFAMHMQELLSTKFPKEKFVLKLISNFYRNI
ncbi:Nif3-like dinuclear metal center hexameric protein [Mycoplasma sp. NEAQ87857]|uniref:Nif3-like dinuclear metal center hexameric protein n=1 Tax=Mycoplasma sp. NEAQ87857 TaxID=2683967 RepID=UPI0013191C33|nr:Nif3-like dinuclear metal center hexameric protein [Mycoplasma sp. NEAQ87857]QGZ97471.1 Nif3-like dinuclear metal center hexameric protein [Mycoplasma sp. NEAQ87857]